MSKSSIFAKVILLASAWMLDFGAGAVQPLAQIEITNDVYTAAQTDEKISEAMAGISSDKITDSTNTIDAAGNVYVLRGISNEWEWVSGDFWGESGLSWMEDGVDPSGWYCYVLDFGYQLISTNYYALEVSGRLYGNVIVEGQTVYTNSFNTWRRVHTEEFLKGRLALTNNTPAVMIPSTNALQGTAADARATGVALYTGYTDWEFGGSGYSPTRSYDVLIDAYGEGAFEYVLFIDGDALGTHFDQTDPEPIEINFQTMYGNVICKRRRVTPTKTSQLTNDGNGTYPFATTNQIPDTTLSPIYGGNGKKYSDWIFGTLPAGISTIHIDDYNEGDGWGLEVNDDPPLYTGINEPDALSLSWEYGSSWITATRTVNPIIGYTFGGQETKPITSLDYVTNSLSSIKTDRITDGTNFIYAARDFTMVNVVFPSTVEIQGFGTFQYSGHQGNMHKWGTGEHNYVSYDSTTYEWMYYNDQAGVWGVTSQIVTGINTNMLENLMGGISIWFAYSGYGPVTNYVGRLALTNDIPVVPSNILLTNAQGTATISGSLLVGTNNDVTVGDVLGEPLPNVAIGSQNISTGTLSFAWGNVNVSDKIGSMALCVNAMATNNLALVWNIILDREYGSHGDGTFNINPLAGLKGFWVGETNMADHIDAIASKYGTEVVAPSTNAVIGTAADAMATGTALYTGFTEWEFSGELDNQSVKSLEWSDENERWEGMVLFGLTEVYVYPEGNKDATSLSLLETDIDITATRHLVTPTKTSQLINDSGFVTTNNSGTIETSIGIYGSLKNGTNVVATGIFSHAEGGSTTAEGSYSHSEGNGTFARGLASHSEGLFTRATERASHSSGACALATNSWSFVWSGLERSPYYGSHGVSTFNVDPINGINGFYIGEQTLQQAIVASIMDTSLSNDIEVVYQNQDNSDAAMISDIVVTQAVTNHVPTIRTAVRDVVDNAIGNMMVNVTNHYSDWFFTGLPSGVTVTSLRYTEDNQWNIQLSNGEHQAMNGNGENSTSLLFLSSEWMEGTETGDVTADRFFQLQDRSMNILTTWGLTVPLSFPKPVPNKFREFRLRLVITAQPSSADYLNLHGAITNGVEETISFETDDGTFPSVTTISTNLYHFVETAPSIFYVEKKQLTPAPLF